MPKVFLKKFSENSKKPIALRTALCKIGSSSGQQTTHFEKARNDEKFETNFRCNWRCMFDYFGMRFLDSLKHAGGQITTHFSKQEREMAINAQMTENELYELDVLSEKLLVNCDGWCSGPDYGQVYTCTGGGFVSGYRSYANPGLGFMGRKWHQSLKSAENRAYRLTD